MTNTQIEWVAETKDRKFGKLVLPWDKAVEAFDSIGARVALPEDIVELRLAGYNGPSSRTRLIPVKVKGENTILYKGTEIVTPAGAKEIVTAHVNIRYPTRSTDFYDATKTIAEEDSTKEPEDRIAIVVAKSGDHSWSKEMPETRFTLGLNTAQYFKEKVESFGMTNIAFLDLEADSTKYANFNYVWFYHPDNDFELNAGDRDLNNLNGAFGVLEKTAEGGSRPSRETILTNIRNANIHAVAKYLEERGMTGIADKFADLHEAILREYKTLAR